MACKKKPPKTTISKTVILESTGDGWRAKAEAQRPDHRTPQPSPTQRPKLRVVDKEEAEILDMWPGFRDVIETHFDSLTTFARKAGISKDAIMKVLTRKYGKSWDAKQRWIIRNALSRLGVPIEDLEHLWMIFLETGPIQFMIGQGRAVMISTTIMVEDLGPADKRDKEDL